MSDPLNYDILKQAEATQNGKPVYRYAPAWFDILLGFIAIVISPFTAFVPFLLWVVYFALRMAISKTVRVKNVATGEIFRVTNKDFNDYNKRVKQKKKQIKHI